MDMNELNDKTPNTGADMPSDDDTGNALLKEPGYLFHLAQEAASRKDPARAMDLIRRALVIDPGNLIHMGALGELLLDEQHYAEALTVFKRMSAIQPRSAETYFYMALAADGTGNKSESADFYRQALERQPDWPEALYNLGTMLIQLGRAQESIEAFRIAVDLRPDWVAAWINLGSALENAGFAEQAFGCWQKALALAPDNSQVHFNCGRHHQRHGRIAAAVESYRCAVAHHPTFAKAWYNLASALVPLGQWAEVAACFEKAIALAPDNDVAHFNLAVALRKQERIDEAMMHCRRALAITPHFIEATVYLYQLARHGCDWRLADQLTPELDRLSDKQIKKGLKPSESPMLSLRRRADPETNLKIARAWGRSIEKRAIGMASRPIFEHHPRPENNPIRIGYISRDFKDHAVAHHIRGLLRTHDRNLFSIYLYACNPDDGSYYRSQCARACDHFVDISALDNAVAAHRIHDDRIDILVDLMGHTQGNRMEILALHPAPIQVGYLGFLGTSGSSFIDYFITDSVVTPPKQAKFYTEKLVFLPHCYQVNDNAMTISDQPYQRRDFGFFEDQLILCCFNQPYKIDQATFATWMKILKGIPQGVLWLLGQNQTARNNFRREAKMAGISTERINFSGALRIDRHLARLQLADLALDTFSYNGGATTANALWAGVPLIALMGAHFVSRMSASALMALGLPELIVHSPEAYVRMALDLLQNRSRLDTLRRKLAHLKNQTPLFNTNLFARHLEKAYTVMLDRFDNGLTPVSFSITSE